MLIRTQGYCARIHCSRPTNTVEPPYWHTRCQRQIVPIIELYQSLNKSPVENIRQEISSSGQICAKYWIVPIMEWQLRRFDCTLNSDTVTGIFCALLFNTKKNLIDLRKVGSFSLDTFHWLIEKRRDYEIYYRITVSYATSYKLDSFYLPFSSKTA